MTFYTAPSTSLASSNPDPAGPGAFAGANAAATFPDRCRIERTEYRQDPETFGWRGVPVDLGEYPCEVMPTKQVSEPVVAGGVEAQAKVVIGLPYDVPVGANDIIIAVMVAGRPEEGTRYRVIGSDAPHSDGLRQDVRTIRITDSTP